ncbi:MAG TPA: L,D-transpeptidase [Pseudonocardia sp.]|nr:L,D-transpeptidase [Pseudonocardia sp.]
MAAALAAAAATVLVGLGHAEEEPEVGGSDLSAALPVDTSTDEAVAETTAARPMREANSTTTSAPRTPEREAAPERIRMAAPRTAPENDSDGSDSAGASDDGSESGTESGGDDAATATPTTTAAPRPAGRTGLSASAPAGDGGGTALVPGTPCTVTARACVALNERKAWLIDRGVIVRGPVPIQHGDEADPTPRGTFHVEWKAEQYTSREYLTQMPYSVFFAPGGIAFHQGGQDTPSAGCVKLEHDDAKAWFAYLQVGDEVQIH